MFFTRCLWTMVVLGLLATGAVGQTLNVSAAVYRDDKLDEAMTDLLQAALSEQEGVVVLDRRHLQLVLGEISFAKLTSDAYREACLGRLLGVQTFVWLTVTKETTLVEVVEAATGRGITVSREKITPADLSEALKRVAREAVRAARQRPAKVEVKLPTLAMAAPVVAGDEARRRAVEMLVLTLSEDLEKAGLTLLHRRFLKDLVLERWMMDKELTQAQQRELPMLGACYVLTAQATEGEERLVLSLLETQTGRRMGSAAWTLAEVRTGAGRAAIAEWVRRRTATARPSVKAAPAPAGTVSLQPESLAPFYQGLLLHNQGYYLDAAASFREAIRCDQRFFEPLRWTQASFAAAGFDEVAQAFADYIVKSQHERWNSISNPKALNADPGVAFVGLTAGDGLPESLRLRVMMAVTDGLHAATGAPAFLAADMAQLRDEFDVLVGLENVSGTTWRQAPPMLFADTLTAHLEPGDGEAMRLRLCVTHLLNPDRLSAVTVTLAADQGRWAEQVAAAGRQLLGSSPEARAAWQPPAARQKDPGPRAELSQRPVDVFKFLKHLRQNSEAAVIGLEYPYTNDWYANVLMSGAHRWLIRTLPPASLVKPSVELAYVTFYDQYQGDKYVAGLEKIVADHPEHPVRLAARLNLLLYRATDENLSETLADLEAVIKQIRAEAPGLLGDELVRYDDTCCLMRRALGLTGGGEGELNPGSPIWTMLNTQDPSIMLRAGGGFPGTSKVSGPVTHARERAIVDLAVERCRWRQEGGISMPVMRQVFARFAEQPEVLRYFCLRYGNKLFTNREEPNAEQSRSLIELYPLYARVVVEQLRHAPGPLDRPEIYLLVTVQSVIDFEGCKNEAYRQARSEIRQAVFEAIEAGRFGKVVPMDIFALFLAIGTRGDAEMAHFLKKLSDRSLAGDPLEDQFWLIQAEWNSGWSAAQRAAFYVPFYERIRQLHPQQMFDRKTRWFYYGLAVTFFRGGRFDLARELLPAMAAGMTEQEAKEDVLGFRPNALYLLALLRQHEHNIPEALRLAQQAVELLGDKEIGLIWGTGLGGASGRGNTANLKSLLGDMIAKLRTDPEAKFVSPFDEK